MVFSHPSLVCYVCRPFFSGNLICWGDVRVELLLRKRSSTSVFFKMMRAYGGAFPYVYYDSPKKCARAPTLRTHELY